MFSSSTTLTFLLVVQVLSALSIIVLVLLQQGKGADMGSAFGSGSAGSLFGASGAANFLSRTTKWAAIVFFVATAGLAYIGHHRSSTEPASGGVMQNFDPSVPQLPGAGSADNGAVPQVPSAQSVPGALPVPTESEVPSVPAAPQQ